METEAAGTSGGGMSVAATAEVVVTGGIVTARKNCVKGVFANAKKPLNSPRHAHFGRAGRELTPQGVDGMATANRWMDVDKLLERMDSSHGYDMRNAHSLLTSGSQI